MTGIAVPVTLDFSAFTGTGFTPTPAEHISVPVELMSFGIE